MKKNFQGYLGIIARMGSKRLPDKHAININQVPIIKYLINRMKTYFDKDIQQEKIKIVILTGSENKNSLLGEIANQCEIEVYYGDDDNIPIRMFNFLKYKKDKFVKGFTTNPSLMRQSGAKSYKSYSIKLLKNSNNKPVSLEVFSDNIDEMYNQGKIINDWGKNVYVKIPVVNTKGKFTGKIIKKLRNPKKSTAGVTLGAPLARFRRSWALFRPFRAVLGRSWALLGRSWDALGRS